VLDVVTPLVAALPAGAPGMALPLNAPVPGVNPQQLPTALPSGMALPTALPSGMQFPSFPTDTATGVTQAPGTTNKLANEAPTASPAVLAGLLAAPPPPFEALVQGAKSLFTRDRVAILHVLSAEAPESEPARDVVRYIRNHRAIGDGHALVGGQTAGDLDATAFMLSRVPYAAATIVGVTLLVLFFLLNSVVLPLKAVGMNFLSIAGSFGALVWIFQDGNLFVQEARPLEPSLPVLLFCIVFGLSMDYEVLMLSRMKEAHDQGIENTIAVAEGLEKSAGLITSAAAIMVTVFAAFALARVVLIQAVGVGMALAVALDATLVRILLVPSTMRLFGELNWWAPRWLGGGRNKRP
jgi:putative drug exporter of the RND superfamily